MPLGSYTALDYAIHALNTGVPSAFEVVDYLKKCGRLRCPSRSSRCNASLSDDTAVLLRGRVFAPLVRSTFWEGSLERACLPTMQDSGMNATMGCLTLQLLRYSVKKADLL